MAVDSSIQRISRLTPLRRIHALIESRVGSVNPEKRALAAANGRTLAEDVVASERPSRPIALRDGYAVASDTIADAGPYSPIAFASIPRRVDVGERLPGGTDAVLPLDAVMLRGGRAEATATVAIGEGVLLAGDDAAPRTPLRRTGERLRAIDIAAIAAADIAEITLREPRIGLVRGNAANTPSIGAACALLARAIVADGAAVHETSGLEAALANQHADAMIAIGGTGSGRNDTSVRVLAELGRVEVHGIAVAPGETAAFGFVGQKPVLLVPGRLDSALAVWLLIGRYLLAKLAGGEIKDWTAYIPLNRKVTSTIGMTELIPVRCADGVAEPLGSGYLSFTALTRSDGWIVVPADSEGFAAGTPVAVQPWP